MIKRYLGACVCAAILCAANATLAQSPRPNEAKAEAYSLHTHIKKLANRIYSISEVGGKDYQQRYDDALTATVQSIRDYVKGGGDLSALTQRNDGQQTPLMLAAYYGYAPVTEELLKHTIVAASINTEDKHGATAWEYSIMALRQSAVACNPRLVSNPFSFVPLYVTQEFYASSDPFRVARDPYPLVRAQLEKAGAVADMGKARKQWHALCKSQGPLTRKKIDQGDDLQKVVIAEGQMLLQGYLDLLQRKKKR